jgi:hypothetical protein
METKNVFWTPELQAKLDNRDKGIIADRPFPWTPPAFRKKNEQGEFVIPKALWPVFTLLSKDGIGIAKEEDFSRISFDQSNERLETEMKLGSRRIDTLSDGIQKVRGYPCEDGTLLDFDKKKKQLLIRTPGGQPGTYDTESKNDVGPEAFIKYINADNQIQIQNAINERSTLTKEELQGLGWSPD